MSVTLVSFFVREQETLGFVLERSRVRPRVVHASVGREEIREAATTLAELFSANRMYAARPELTTDMAWLRPLSERLLGPLVETLPRGRSLIVSAHGDLHWLPLHMLEVQGRPLVARFGVSYAPNLSLYGVLVRRREPGRAERDGAVALTTAALEDRDPVHESFSLAAERFAARTEAPHLRGPLASAEAAAHALENAGIVYLGCHGVFQAEQPLDSALLLSDGTRLPSRYPPVDSSRSMTVRDVLGVDVRARVVVLAACLSARQAFAPGDEPLGFPGAFLLGGAEAVLAANWNAERVATAAFMEEVLDKWLGGERTLGEAVRDAYRIIMRDRPHPFHWAAFSLYGNDRLRYGKGPSPAGKHGGHGPGEGRSPTGGSGR